MPSDGLETGRSDASTVLAVRLSTELAWADPAFEIGRETLGGLREDTVLG